ncbi:ATP-binding protein [bacterium]|nr:MAG: ATP-binding protein [bacterium]
MADELHIPIVSEVDIVMARQQGRALAAELGFASSEQALIATAISELARNILLYAGRGLVQITTEHRAGRAGIGVVASDRGPGIQDLQRALEDGFSTGRGLGLGLPGTKRIMDDFELVSEVGKGTRVAVKKWVR